MTAARVFIGRSARGNRWHIVPKPGTAFPLGLCGSSVSWSSLKTAERLGPINGCKNCERLAAKEQA